MSKWPTKRVGTLGDDVGRFWLVVHCACGRRRVFDPAKLSAAHGADLALQTFYERARCSRCGRRPNNLFALPQVEQYAALAAEAHPSRS